MLDILGYFLIEEAAKKRSLGERRNKMLLRCEGTGGAPGQAMTAGGVTRNVL